MTIVWELVSMFATFEPTPVLVAATTTIAIALVGYFKKENVLPLKAPKKK